MTHTVIITPAAGLDLAAAINAALADPTVTTVVLTAGEFLLHSSVIVPSGKALIGAGRDQTVLRAAADFQIIDQSNNAVVISQPNATGITLSDFAVDASKISPSDLRLNGVFMKFATDFAIARVDVSNATGYAHFAQGDLGSFQAGNPYIKASGNYDDCQTFNSQVHFEQMFADGITLTNVHARDGDGDISTEAYFHPLWGSSNITYIDSSAYGAGFLGFSLISSFVPLSNINIINTQVEILHPSQGSALIALGAQQVDGLHIVDSSFIAHYYIAVRIGGVSGTASGSYFQGGSFAVEVTTAGDGSPSDFVVTDSTALGLQDPASGFGVAGVHSDQASYLSWQGGSIESRAGLMIPVSGAIDLSPTTQIIGAGFDAVLAYQEEGPAVQPFAAEDWTLPASPVLAGALLRVEHLAYETAEDELGIATSAALTLAGGVLTIDGRTVATVTGGTLGSDLLVQFTALATAADAQAVLEAVTYRSTADDPATSFARLLDASLTLANGMVDQVNAAISHTPIDDASAIDPGAASGLTYLELAAPTCLLPDAVLSDVDSADLAGSTLTIAITAGLEAADVLAITANPGSPTGITRAGQGLFFNGAAFGVVVTDSVNGVFRVALGNGSSLAAVEALIRSIGFSHSGVVDVTVTRTLSVRLINGAGREDAPILLDLVLQPAQQPITAATDAVSVLETGVAEFAPLANDLNPDGAAETIVAIAGQEIAINGTVTLASGAQVTLLANGQLRYDPAGAFADLAGAETGTTLAEAQDEFSYTLSGGGAASVTVTITGENTGGEVIRGDGQANSLRGALEFQSLNAKAGNDVLDDAGLTVRLNGGGGDDTYLIASSTASIKETADQGHDHVVTALTNYTLSNFVEDLTFTGAATARFYGYGNTAGNRITGGDAADFVFGYAGDDVLIGGAGADYLDGGNDDDLLVGGSGNDLLIGGSGADTFRFDTALGSSNVDTITDFASGSDVIALNRSVYGALDAGVLAAAAFETGTAATTAETRIVYDPATGSIYYDADGNGAGSMVLFAVLSPGAALSASNFFGV